MSHKFTLIIIFLLLGRVLLLLGVTRGSLGFLFVSGLLFRTFLVLGLGPPGCRLLAFVLARLIACLPRFFGLKKTGLNQCVNLLPKIPWEKYEALRFKAHLTLGLKMVDILDLTNVC